MKILFVDDDAALSESLVALMSQEFPAHSFQTASSGEQALALLDASTDLLMTDVVMEPMDGFTLKTAALQRFPSLSLLFLSGYDLSDYRALIEPHRLLQKPLDIEALRDALAEVLALRTPPAAPATPIPVSLPDTESEAERKPQTVRIPAPKPASGVRVQTPLPAATQEPATVRVSPNRPGAASIPKAATPQIAAAPAENAPQTPKTPVLDFGMDAAPVRAVRPAPVTPVPQARPGVPTAKPAAPAVATPVPRPTPVPKPVAPAAATPVPQATPVPRPVAPAAATPVPQATPVPKPVAPAAATPVPQATPVPKPVAPAAATPVPQATPVPKPVAPAAATPVPQATPVPKPVAPAAATPVPQAKPAPAAPMPAMMTAPPAVAEEPKHQFPTDGSEWVGTVLGNYQINRILGTGRWGHVYQAIQISIKRSVALRILDASLANDPAEKARFVSDARAKANAQHPTILAVFEAGEQDGTAFCAHEFVAGHTLKELADQGQKLDEAKTLKVLRAVAEGMSHLQSHQIPH
ncbi:MAG: Serine/threonine-protein kinase PrkC, partial [Verrucomicrobiota bacterium]